MNPPDLTRTAAALAAYDEHDQNVPDLTRLSNDACVEWLDENDRLARAVGVAFGLDTSDRNDPGDCAELLRPGPPPGGGREESFVRRMVREWRERQGGS